MLCDLTAWIGAGAYGITMALAPASSAVINRWGHRVSACSGCAVCALGLLSSSYAHSIYVLYGTFMVLFAVGTCFAYTPCMTIASDYFEKHVTVAVGIMMAGTSSGTLILNPLAQKLCDTLGWRVALRILSVNCLVGLLCALTFVPLATRDKKTAVQPIQDSAARERIRGLQLWKNKVYILWLCSIFLVMFGYYIPYVHLVSSREVQQKLMAILYIENEILWAFGVGKFKLDFNK